MRCPSCGQYIVQQAVSAETALLVHRLLKHQPPIVQNLAIFGLTIAGTWAAGKLVGKLR